MPFSKVQERPERAGVATQANTSRRPDSYSQILKSSSIIGGAQGINYLIAMIRTKLVAMFLGPAGVGVVGVYGSITEFVGLATGLGINSSGVREIAEAHGSGDPQRVAKTVKVLRRACWITGMFGWVVSAAFAWPLSVWTFGSSDRAFIVALLGITLLLSAVNGGQKALLQGTRRIGDLARLSVLSSVANTLIALGLYAWLRQDGIVPVIILNAAVTLAFSWWFSRRIHVGEATLSWYKTWENSRRLVGVGIAFMYGSMLASAVGLATRSLIVRALGIEANGIYQAAWAISGLFAGFILGAMGTDFYPRLTAVAGDHHHVNRLVNEQTEIGMLLALPGLLATLVFAPLVMRIFYTAKFLPGAELLPWFVLGVFGRVITWPIGFIQMAKGSTGWLIVSHTHSNIALMVLTLVFIKLLGLPGTAIAFAALYPLHALVTLYIAHRLTQFRWSASVLKLFGVSGCLIAAGFVLQRTLTSIPSLLCGALLTGVSCWFAARGIVRRLGPRHRIVQKLLRIPGMNFAIRM